MNKRVIDYKHRVVMFTCDICHHVFYITKQLTCRKILCNRSFINNAFSDFAEWIYLAIIPAAFPLCYTVYLLSKFNIIKQD